MKMESKDLIQLDLITQQDKSLNKIITRSTEQVLTKMLGQDLTNGYINRLSIKQTKSTTQ